MVYHAVLDLGRLGDGKLLNGLLGLQQAKQMKSPVEHTAVTLRGDHGHIATSNPGGFQQEPLRPLLRQAVFPAQAGNQLGGFGGTYDQRAAPGQRVAALQRPVQQARNAPLQLLRGRLDDGRAVGSHQGSQLFAVVLDQGTIAQGLVTQPHVVTVFSVGSQGTQGAGQGQTDRQELFHR